MTQTYIGTLVIETCCNCGIVFGLDESYRRRLLQSHDDFYCPNGHPQHFVGETDKERLQKEVNSLTQRNAVLLQRRDELIHQMEGLKYSNRALKAAKTKVMNRVKNGVCPCCNRTFSDLQSHFKTKHPELFESK